MKSEREGPTNASDGSRSLVRRAGVSIVGGERAATIEANGARLFAAMPEDAGPAKVVTDDNIGRSFYAEGVVGRTDGRGPIPWHLNTTLEEGVPLFLKGTAHGVGTTRLVTDFARMTNARQRNTSELLVAYVSIAPGTKTVRALVESVAVGIEAHLATRIGRGAGALQLAMLTGLLRHCGTRCLVLDHVDRLEGAAIDALVDLMDRLACGADVREDGNIHRKIGVVLVAKRSPSSLFRGKLRLLQRLEKQIIELDSYQRDEDVVEALGQVYPQLWEALQATGSVAEAGRDMLLHTIGLPGRMSALFGMMERLRVRHPDAQFPALLDAAKRQLPLRVGLGPKVVLATGEREQSLRLAETATTDDDPAEQTDEPAQAPKRNPRLTRAQMLARKAKNAERAGRALSKSRRIKHPTILPPDQAR